MSRSTAPASAGVWVVAGPVDALAWLRPLIAARRRMQQVKILGGRLEILIRHPETVLPANTAGVLLIGPRRRSPRRTLPGLWLRVAGGSEVPVGWLPDAGPRIADYARSAARILARPSGERALVVLGQWDDRALRVGLRTKLWMERHGDGTPGFLWTAERIGRSDMLNGLALGPAVTMYFGHGRPRGWAGYHGVRREHFVRPWPEPMGALLGLCCENASRWRTGMSFAEHLVLDGVAGAMLAATGPTRHEDNRCWGPALCEAYTERQPETLADLVRGAEVPERLRHGGPYRFIGDPLIPLRGAPGVAARAAEVFAPAPDEALPAW